MASPDPPIPKTMKAWTYNRRGLPQDVLTLRNLLVPTPGANDVLIKVTHVGFNAGGIAAFVLFPHLSSAPCVPEMEFSGVVIACGNAAALDAIPIKGESFKVGDEVIGMRKVPADLVNGNGCLAEYVVAPLDTITAKPGTLSVVQSAGLPACGQTAVQACDLASVKLGDKVLVTGGSGGLGSILVQYCRAVVGESGKVIATCSGKNAEMVKGLGADETIDYTKEKDLSAYLTRRHSNEPFNAIFDVVSDDQLHKKCPAYLTEKGMFVLLGNMHETSSPTWWGMLSWVIANKLKRFQPVWLGGVPRDHRMMNGLPSLEDLQRIVKVVDEKGIKLAVDSVWKMEDVPKAYEKLQSQRARGKIIIDVQSEEMT